MPSSTASRCGASRPTPNVYVYRRAASPLGPGAPHETAAMDELAVDNGKNNIPIAEYLIPTILGFYQTIIRRMTNAYATPQHLVHSVF